MPPGTGSPRHPGVSGSIKRSLIRSIIIVAATPVLAKRALDEGIRCIVLRLKRTSNPDMVCMERFHHFTGDMERHGVFVLLCGVRPEFARVMKNLRFEDCLPEARIFLEEPQLYSSTLKAVRYGLELSGDPSCSHCARVHSLGVVAQDAAQDLYYLV
jgi:hypothetical protein